ncbi:MAG: hypothetical protein Q7S21_06490 [archaeon]|nr:hypothetical protein [archaeon]
MLKLNQKIGAKKSRKGPIAFLAFVIIVSLVFVYLLFFYSGLELQQAINSEGQRQLLLTNNSPLVAENIQVFAVLSTGKKLVQLIPIIEAGEKKQIILTGINQSVVIITVEAPFQKTIEQQIDLRAFQNIDITSKIIAPKLVFRDNDLNVTIELCNNGAALKDIRIEEKHEPSYFAQKDTTQLIDLLTKSCESIEYKLTALKQGTTTIFFNIKVLDSMKTLTQEVEVR